METGRVPGAEDASKVGLVFAAPVNMPSLPAFRKIEATTLAIPYQNHASTTNR